MGIVKVVATLVDPYGITSDYESEWKPENRDIVVFMWEDGNYACDCNRSIFLHDLDFGSAWPCGDTIRCVRLTIDGEEVYAE